MEKSETHLIKPNANDEESMFKIKNSSSLTLDMDVYGRQNSENEFKENDISPQTGNFKMHNYSRQLSGLPFIAEKSHKVDIDDKKKSTSTINSTNSDYKIQNRDTRCYVFQCFSFLVTILTLVLVLFQFYKMNQSEDHHVPGAIMESKQVYEESDDVSGSFKLDQLFLYENKSVRWLPDENSRIVPSKTEPCLLIPDDGKYLIFSRFTFRIPPGEKETSLTHKLVIKSENEAGEKTQKVFKRQYVSIVEHQLENDSELRKPSVFIQSFELLAGNEVCTGVSNPELLYISPIDNDVTIIKV